MALAHLSAEPFQVIDNIDTCSWPWPGWTARTLPTRFGALVRFFSRIFPYISSFSRIFPHI
eukprot:SAG31_NODE_32184_length_359_cov_0.596154_1_plen_60_part_01